MTIFLFFLALIIVIIGGLMLIVAMFRVSFWWGIGGLVFAPIQLIFVFKYWDESRASIMVQTIGLLLILATLMIGGDKLIEEYKTQFNQHLQSIAPEQMQQLNELQSMAALPGLPAPVAPTHVAPASVVPAAGTQSNDVDTAPVFVTPAGDQKVIHKCVDAKGRVAYTEKPCEGAQEKKVITIQSGYDDAPAPSASDVMDKVKKMVAPDSEPASYRCDGRTQCTQMTSCDEAVFFLNHCPGVEMDGNKDGIPCEKQWCGSE